MTNNFDNSKYIDVWKALTLDDIKGLAVRACNNQYYYFDDNGIYCVTDKNSLIGKSLHTGCIREIPNKTVLISVAKTLSIGSTFDDLKKGLIAFQFNRATFAMINRTYGRLLECKMHNIPGTDSLDYIKLYAIIIVTEPNMSYKAIYLKHKREFDNIILDILSEKKAFKEYKISIDNLIQKEVRIHRNGIIDYIYELK